MVIEADVIKFIKSNINTPIHQVVLKANKLGMPSDFIANQINGIKKARIKLPEYAAVDGFIFPPSLNLEQCSSSTAATYKASIINGEKLIDITGGFGIDTLAFSRRFDAITYVEKNPSLYELFAHNISALTIENIAAHQGDGIIFLDGCAEQSFDMIYIDPARRGEGNKKLVRIQDYEPDLSVHLSFLLTKAKKVMAKLSPMLDIQSALNDLPQTEEVHIVSVNNECKELLFLLGDHVESPKIVAVNLKKGKEEMHSFGWDTPAQPKRFALKVEAYLYEPNVSIMKAGRFSRLESDFAIHKLDSNSHLFTSEEYFSDFPGRKFAVEGKVKLTKKAIKAFVPDGKANLTCRNYPMGVNELRKKLGLKEGGDLYVFATTMGSEKMGIVCRAVK